MHVIIKEFTAEKKIKTIIKKEDKIDLGNNNGQADDRQKEDEVLQRKKEV